MTEEQPTDDPTPDVPSRSDPADRPLPVAGSGEPAPPATDRSAHVEIEYADPALERQRRERVRYLSGEDLAPQGRRIKLPLILFIATCLTTFWAGCKGWAPGFVILDFEKAAILIQNYWPDGLLYMVAVMSILLAHEMGHFVQTVRYHIPASWPFFIPVPILPMGTMGAVIGLDGSRADRKEMFDMGISGPLAGLVICVPMGFYAIYNAELTDITGRGITFHDPLLFQWMIEWVHGELPEGKTLLASPLYVAAWVGMLITGLNMMPLGQLDGGHVAYCMFGERANTLARALLVFIIVWMIVYENYNWVIMVGLVILIGTDHPPTHNDKARMGPFRYVIGIASLMIPIICFMPTPISLR